jgi:hypothetical protein
MLDNKGLWIGLSGALLVLYAAAAFLVSGGDTSHGLVRLAAIVLAAHVLELPLAFRALRGKPKSTPRLVALTLLFGGFWWIPAGRGVFAAA